jgi:hypothetical protein
LPAPPQTAFQQIESRNTVTETPATTVHHPITSAHSPSAETESNTASETVSPVSNPASTANEPKRPSDTKRLANIVYGYGEESPLNWSKSKLKSNAFGESDKSSGNDADKENDTLGQAPQLTSSFVNTSYTSSFVPPQSATDYAPGQHSSFQHTRRYDYPPGSTTFGESSI